MSSSRRRFLHQAAALGLLHGSRHAFSQMASMQHMQAAGARVPNAPNSNHPMLHSLQLTPFVDALPVPGPLGAPQPDRLRITMREIHAKVHRDVPPTRFWSYGPDPLGPVIEARSGQPLQIEWINNLPTKHFLPIDHTLHGCGADLPDVRTITHVHGAKVPSKDDGYPEDWFVPGKSRVCHYPLQQNAATLWYHDHAMGINRLNSYAGLAGLFLIRDDAEDALNLPTGKYEVPLVLYDRDFTTDGQLYYGVSGDPDHPWIPEFNADGILINGKIRPYFEVEPRLYRFRAVNVANSRFFALALDDNHPFLQIGSDQGLLAAPVQMKILSLAPAERADLLIDFAPLAGKTIHMSSGGYNILQFRVAAQTASSHNNVVPKTMPAIRRTPESEAITTRTITLSEYHDQNGNPMVMLLNRKHWHEPVTETPKTQLHRDLGVRQPHRRHPPHAPASRALPDPRPPRLRALRIRDAPQRPLQLTPRYHPCPTN